MIYRSTSAPAGSAAVPLGAGGVDSRLRRDFAAPARCAASLFGVGADPRLRRDPASPAGDCASAVGANLRLRRDYAAPAGGCNQVDVEFDWFSSSFQPCMSPIDRHRFVSDVLHGRCASVAPVGTNSCGVGHGNASGVVHDNSCVVVHASSSGTYTYGNSRVKRGHGDH